MFPYYAYEMSSYSLVSSQKSQNSPPFLSLISPKTLLKCRLPQAGLARPLRSLLPYTPCALQASSGPRPCPGNLTDPPHIQPMPCGSSSLAFELFSVFSLGFYVLSPPVDQVFESHICPVSFINFAVMPLLKRLTDIDQISFKVCIYFPCTQAGDESTWDRGEMNQQLPVADTRYVATRDEVEMARGAL